MRKMNRCLSAIYIHPTQTQRVQAVTKGPVRNCFVLAIGNRHDL
ncbi:hypothetical protein TSAR_003175 [Trichomalopsis sarcophagae]|uniref:Uncharacterized protein n=1 Tax=Trichomalopsis sarcophagae TaxID=543379 RepID=A0A232EV02_9HYME|nr:hypothetical protein TSAR_003175 [Trichomalopsis sarcophagae]